MPTYNRRVFVPQAITYFLRQDYPNKEIIVVDNGTEPVQKLVPTDNGIRYVRLSTRMTMGAKCNLSCWQAQGEIIAHWDDDDWHAPHRLRYQVGVLLEARRGVWDYYAVVLRLADGAGLAVYLAVRAVIMGVEATCFTC